jgi:hypothetical protein
MSEERPWILASVDSVKDVQSRGDSHGSATVYVWEGELDDIVDEAGIKDLLGGTLDGHDALNIFNLKHEVLAYRHEGPASDEAERVVYYVVYRDAGRIWP